MKKVLVWVLVALFGAGGLVRAQEAPETAKYVVKAGTRIPLVLVNSVSTKTSQVGDRVYLQTSFQIGRASCRERVYVLV